MSDDSPDPFQDQLLPDEALYATMAAGGPPRANGARVWIQLGLTGQRVLAVVMVQAPHGGAWQPVAQHAAPRSSVRIARYPRTPSSSARLEVHGLPEELVLLDIDDPSVFPWLEPFLSAWGAPVDGAGTVKPRPAQAELQTDASPDTRLLIGAAVGLLVLVVFCCGCSGLIGMLGAL